MVEYKTIKSEEIKVGSNDFIEVARKKAVSETGENEFISISRGFLMMDGSKRYRKSFTIPIQKDVVEFVAKKIKEMA
ncbi:MAG: hypothetical protein QXY45_01150 [Candidatus Aenigmatarchaeota archaeon]